MSYSVKMRAEKDGHHISGAERIVDKNEIAAVVLNLLKRGQQHPNGEADFMILKIDKIQQEITNISPLEVSTPPSRNLEEAKALILNELEQIGLNGQGIWDLLYSLKNLRGAALVDAKTLERLDPDIQRGVRATNMDYAGKHSETKDHFKEALCLASKVASCPYILCELCISDDPEYTTGYFASKERGYVRIANIKSKGDTKGGRIFVFNGQPQDITKCINYLEKCSVMVTANEL